MQREPNVSDYDRIRQSGLAKTSLNRGYP